MTLSISDIKRRRILYLVTTAFFFVFATIYEYFSHDVFSAFMTKAYLLPLGGLAITEIYRLIFIKTKKASDFAIQLLAGAVAWLTLGSVFEGVLEIYGTTNHLIIIFPVIGFAQLIASVVAESKSVVLSSVSAAESDDSDVSEIP